MESHFGQVDLNEAILEVLSDLSLVIEEKGAVVQGNALPAVFGLDTQLRQLLYNLINDALKFNGETPIVKVCYENIPEDENLLAPSDNYEVITV